VRNISGQFAVVESFLVNINWIWYENTGRKRYEGILEQVCFGEFNNNGKPVVEYAGAMPA
jgi:hypothetical protein